MIIDSLARYRRRRTRRKSITRAIRHTQSSFLRQRLRDAGFISLRHRYFFMSILKNASSKTLTVLWHLEGCGPITGDVHARGENDPRLSPATATPAVAEAAILSRDFFRFCIWRDPVDRLASAYVDRIREPKRLKPQMADHRQEIALHFGHSDPREISFAEFAEFVCALPDKDRNPHWMSQWRLSLADYVDYDKVVDLADYQNGMALVLDALGVAQSERPDLATRLNPSRRALLKIDESRAALIRSTYAKDYEMIERT